MNLADQLQSVGRFFNVKARKRFDGLAEQSSVAQQTRDSKKILIHCASYGEFEQIKPLIELIRSNHSDAFITLSFFSPSGYEMAWTYQPVDQIIYFPIDTRSNIRVFIDKLKPDLVLLVKYEVWVNFINNLHARNIPMFLVSGLFLPQYSYFKWYGSIFRQSFKKLTGILVQDESSKKLLNSIRIQSVVCGDSRADRVLERSQIEKQKIDPIKKWKSKKPILILGSIWPEDWAVFKPVMADILEHYNLIIAPHEFSESFMLKILADAGTGILWSEHSNEIPGDTSLILLNEMGLLADIYRYGDVAYIGGAFKQGLHNIFEPAVYRLPILFGPKLTRFPEALTLIERNAAKRIENVEELRVGLLSLAKNKELRLQQGQRAKDFVLSSAGSSSCIYSHIKEYLN